MLNLLFLALAASSGADPAALERALASVRPQNICADVQFIASDELEGRDTPSHGQRLAARYLRARLQRLGFQAMGDNGYFDEYHMTATGVDPAKTALELERAGAKSTLKIGADYFLAGNGVIELDVSGPVVSVGRGAKDDYKDLDVKGAWALAVVSREVNREERTRQAKAAGALGLISMSDPSQPEPDWSGLLDGKRTTVEGQDERGEPPASLPQLWLSRAGATAVVGDASLPKRGTRLPVVLHDRRAVGSPQDVVLENVCGFWPGSDATLSKEVLILSAHYDHVGVQGGVVYNGADDNGSGTTGLLALAEALKSYGPMRRSVLLLWVSGEEKGLWGSAAWTKKPTLTEGYHAVADINIDMIGRNAPDKLLITPTKALKEYNGLTRLAESLGALEGFPKLGNADEYWRRSDHMNFADNLKIPVAFLFSDVHEDYHQPTDDADKIDCDKIRRVVRLVLRMLDGLQADALGV